MPATSASCGGSCGTGAGVAGHGPAVRKVLWLSWITREGPLGLLAGIQANGMSLVGWALGSVIEGLASVIVIWRFTGNRRLSETSERRTQKAVAVSSGCCRPTSRWRRCAATCS